MSSMSFQNFVEKFKMRKVLPFLVDECLKHSSYTRVGSSFSQFFHSTSIVFMDKYLILSLV